MTPKVPCTVCKGSGCAKMPAKLLRTYHAIASSETPLSIPELAKKSREGNIQTAMNKRVNRLLELGLIKDVHVGRGVRRFVVKNGD